MTIKEQMQQAAQNAAKEMRSHYQQTGLIFHHEQVETILRHFAPVMERVEKESMDKLNASLDAVSLADDLRKDRDEWQEAVKQFYASWLNGSPAAINNALAAYDAKVKKGEQGK